MYQGVQGWRGNAGGGGKQIDISVARDLDLTPSALRHWIKQAMIDLGKGTEGALSTAEGVELKMIRKQNKQLMIEHEIQKNATVFFAKESS